MPARDALELLLRSVAAARAAADAYKQLPPAALASLAEECEGAQRVLRDVGALAAATLTARADVSPLAYRSFVVEQCFAMLEACARHERASKRAGAPMLVTALEDKLAALSVLLEKSAREAAAAAAPGRNAASSQSAMPEESDVVFVD